MGSMLDLLKPDGYIMVNKKLVRTIGLNESLILGSLCSKQDYWNNHWDFQKYGQFDGFFFCTAEQFECETTLSPYQQRNAITKLEAAGLIETDLRGNPAKKYFRVNEYELELLFFDEEHLAKLKSKMSKNLTTSSEEISQQDVKKFDTNNIRHTDITNSEIKGNPPDGEGKPKSKRKSKTKNKYPECVYEDIISFLNDVTGRKYQSTTQRYRGFINARLDDGYSIDDFKTVIEKKWEDWRGTEREKFVRPETLFSPSHFDDYLNQPWKRKQPKWDGTTVSDETF